jgi:hypothetical protein
MTHEQSTDTASHLFDSGMLTQSDSREAARLYLLRKFTRRDKESLSALVRRYPQALNTDRYKITP